MAAPTLSTSMSTPPPPYRRMSDFDRTNNSNNNYVPAYCCLGTVHIKSATFMVCLTYLVLVGYAWYLSIPEWTAFPTPTNSTVDTNAVITLLTAAAVIACALLGLHFEQHLCLIPLITMQLLGLAYTSEQLFNNSFTTSNGARAMMLFVLWLGVLSAMGWVTVIVFSCFRLFHFYRLANRSMDATSNSLPFNSPSTSPVIPMITLNHRNAK